jgi:hypothetical protein
MGERGRHLSTPARVAALVVAALAVLRLVAAFVLHGPVLMPDEYLYTAIARSIAHGGLPSVRGGHLNFIPVLASVLVAPAWLIHDVGIAYRVAQAEGVIAMSTAALPAFALGRRVGLSPRSAAAGAVFAVLVPDLVFSGMLLSEAFAYPLFLLTVLVAVDSLRAPTRRRQLLFLAASVLLCLTRLQFAFIPLGYLAAAVLAARPLRPLRPLRTHAVVSGGLALAAACVTVVGTRAVVGRYDGWQNFHHGLPSVAHWTGSNLVLLLVAAGWVTAPGAIVGIARMLRRGDPGARAFAALAVVVGTVLVCEAGVFGAGLGQLEERYTFYAAPLLAIAFLYALEQGLVRTRSCAVLTGGLAALAFLLPLDDPLFTGMRDQSPVLMAFLVVQRHLTWRAPIAAGVLLLALALAALALGRRGAGRPLAALAAALAVSVGVANAFVLTSATRVAARASWDLPLPGSGASFLAFPGNTVPSDLTTALFWNPEITRVLVLGNRSVDSFTSVPVSLAAGGVLRTADRRTVDGPVVFQPGVDAVRANGPLLSAGGQLAAAGMYRPIRIHAIVVGWSPATESFAPNGEILVPGSAPTSRVARSVHLRLRGSAPPTKLRFRCSSGATRTVTVGAAPVSLTLPLVGRGVASCRFAIVSGQIRWRKGYPETVQARVVLGAAVRGA